MSVSSRDEPTTDNGPMTAGVHIPPPLFFLGPLALGMLVHHTAQTPPEPWKPTGHIVTWGPFAYTRNPIYLAFTGIYVALTVLANSVWPVLPLPAALVAIQRGVVERRTRTGKRRPG